MSVHLHVYLSQAHLCPHVYVRLLYLLLKSKQAKDSFESQRVLLRNIKKTISSQSMKFHGFSEQVGNWDFLSASGNCVKLQEHVCALSCVILQAHVLVSNFGPCRTLNICLFFTGALLFALFMVDCICEIEIVIILLVLYLC